MAMHLGLELLVTVGWWQYMMISVLFTFLAPEVSRTILDGMTLGRLKTGMEIGTSGRS